MWICKNDNSVKFLECSFYFFVIRINEIFGMHIFTWYYWIKQRLTEIRSNG